MLPNEAHTAQPPDLTHCEKELIHIPSRIQPHGVLLTVREPEWTILQASANTLSLVGKPPEELHGKSLETLFGDSQVAALRERCQRENIDGAPLYIATLTLLEQEKRFDCIIHRVDNVLALELERAAVAESGLDYYALVKKTLPSLDAARTVTELCQIVTQQVRQIGHYDRVMIYQFHEDGHGSVIAEDRRDDLESSLNLHYPEADIPRQARRLLELNPLRLIADVNYTPADLLPTCNPVTGKPLDMSNCLLRSISPMHIEYLQNMGVGATLGVSLLQDGRLWGLIIGHHYAPLHLAYDVRTFCEFLGKVVSMQLSSKAENEEQEYRLQMQTVQTQLVALMTKEENCLDGLHQHSPNLLDFIEAGGAVICAKGKCIRLGETPDDAFLMHLAAWLSANSAAEVLAIDHLSGTFPEALAYKEIASGLLAITISREQNHYLFWFRPENVHCVSWGGNPNKSVEIGSDGAARLSPRKSFKVWNEMVQNKSQPWKQIEIGAAHNLRHALMGVLLTETNTLQEQQILQISQQTAQNERLQARLKERTERLTLATQSGELGVWEYDIAANILTWDQQMMTLYGLTPETFSGCYEAWSERLHPDDKARAEAEFHGAIQSDGKFNTEFRIVLLNGTTRYIRANAVILKDESNTHIRAIGLNQDVTDRKLLESQLAHAQKLESVGQLAAGIAHEINTPIQYIGDNIRFLTESFLELQTFQDKCLALLVSTPEGTTLAELMQQTQAAQDAADTEYLFEEIPKALAQSLDGVERVSQIVLAMKHFSHPGSKDKIRVDINRAIDSTITVARNEWKYLAEMVTDFDATLPLVSCLPGDFNQVVLNLIINASHAIADATRETGEKGTITVSTRRDGDWVEIRIQDTGTGIPESARGRIFDPFFTTKEVGKGTGQGLSIAHSIIVEKHEGTIGFETEMGKGATFVIRLPLEAEDLHWQVAA